MHDKAAGSGGFTLEVPVDASAISADDLKQQNLKIVVKTCEGELFSQPVKLKADGSGSARFSFAKNPGALTVLIGPDRAEDAELADSQTITTGIPPSLWASKRQLVLEPLRVSYWYWWWWWRWCREFTIHGHVICPDGKPVPGAEVCAYDVDWFWWWWTKQQVGCAVTDINGSFDITFRWCCGFWPWWWWRYRIWDYQPEIAEAIVPVLERDPRIQLGRASSAPSLEVFEPLLARQGLDTSKPLATLAAGQLDQIRTSLLEKLPKAPELAQLRIWPWWPWRPWWDCTPDIIFKVTQDCHFPGAVIVNEGYGDTRWDIPDPLNVTLIANDLACCKPVPPCVEGDCIEISSFCSDEYLSLDSIGGNPGALLGQPDGYAPGDRPFSETIAVLKANTFVGVDYYEIEVWDPVAMTWGPPPSGTCRDFCRHWIQPVNIGPWPNGDVPFKWVVKLDGVDPHLVVESREHYEATTPLPPPAYWEISSQLVVPLDSTKFADGTYKFHVVGWQDAGAGKIKNGHVLKVCGIDELNEWMLTFDNRAYPDMTVTDCGSGFVHLCTKEPTTAINNVTIDGNPIPECGTTEINGDLVVDFEAYDPDGHLSHYGLSIHWGASHEANLLTLPGAALTWLSGDGQGPDYASALGQGHGASSPHWQGGTMRLTVPAATAFPVPCCYLIRLEAVKRHHLGYSFGSCGYNCVADQYYNVSEFTVGAGVCDPPKLHELAAIAKHPAPEPA
jgi:hypothetical protein